MHGSSLQRRKVFFSLDSPKSDSSDDAIQLGHSAGEKKSELDGSPLGEKKVPMG